MQPTIPSQPIPTREDVVVRLALTALQAWGGDIDQGQVKRILPMWRHFSLLTPREIKMIIRAFPREER